MTKEYTDMELEELTYSEEYGTWLMKNGIDYEIVVCNGDMLLDAMEKHIGFDDFLKQRQI